MATFEEQYYNQSYLFTPDDITAWLTPTRPFLKSCQHFQYALVFEKRK